MRRPAFRRAAEIAISSGLLAAALWKVNLTRLWQALSSGNYYWLLPSALAVFALLLLKTWRWRLLYCPGFRLPFASLLTALSAGFFVSNILPARLGEVTRLFLIAGEQQVGIGRSVSTILIEHLLDLATLLLILVVLALAGDLPAIVSQSARIVAILAAAGIAVMMFLSLSKGRVLTAINRVFKHVRFFDRPNIRAFTAHLLDGFTVMHTRFAVPIILLSLLGWSLVIATAWSSAQALGLDAPFIAIVVAVIATTLGMVVPSSPGYIGVFHYIAVISMTAFGVDKDKSMAFAILWHAVNYLTLSISGFAILCIRGVSIGSIGCAGTSAVAERPERG